MITDIELNIARKATQSALIAANGDKDLAVDLIVQWCEADAQLFNIFAELGFDVLTSASTVLH